MGHGGNIYSASQALGISENKVIDFSASINPLGVPKGVISDIVKNSRYLFNYPEPDAAQLRLNIANHCSINPKSIICGNGSTELIYLVARALQPGRVLIPAPTFSEYERAIISQESGVRSQKQKTEIKYFLLKRQNNFDISPDEFIKAIEEISLHSKLKTQNSKSMAFLCNPNNPTGRLVGKDEMLKIARAAKKHKCHLVVDEAFIDFAPEHSIISEVQHNPYLIVLRSMTKFYALSGLRLGYGIFPLRLMKIVKEHKEPWTVNTLAQRAGIAAIKDTQYLKETFRVMTHEKKFLEDGFGKVGIKHIPSAVNYYLIQFNNAKKIVASLRNKGILVRDCSDFSGLDSSYIRVAVKSRKDNARLIRELSKLCRA